ncbi:MAG: SgcJ/EcaC family oxidoreductase [Rhizomicrobium sp.]
MSNQQKVMNFIAAWEARDIDKILSLMTPDAFYHNIPMQPVQGREAIRGMLGAFLANATDVRWTVHHMAESQAAPCSPSARTCSRWDQRLCRRA